jgi:hypothetical protein
MKLAKIQKKILNYLYGFAINKKPIFSKQETIAKECKCRREHVNRTLRLFKEIGLIKLISQGRRSPKIIKFLVPVSQIFFYIERTLCCTSKSIEGIKDTSNEELAYFKEILEKEESKRAIVFPSHIINLGISFEQKLKLSLCSESAYQLALERAKKKQKDIRDIPNYVVGAAISIEMQRGTKLNWKYYYANK